MEAFAFRRLFKRVTRDPIGLWLRPRNGRDQGGVDGRLGTLPQGQSIRQYLDAAAISKGNVDVHVPQEDVGCNTCTGFAADSRRGPLQGCPACSENAGRRNSGAVGSAVRAREPPGSVWDSINAREAGSRSERRLVQAEASKQAAC